MAHSAINWIDDVGALDALAGQAPGLDAGLPFLPPYIPTPPLFGHANSYEYDGTTTSEVKRGTGAPAVVPSPGLATHAAFIIPNIDEPLYDRIHISPTLLDLGNVLQNTSTTFRVWNAFAVPKTLSAINAFNAGGLTITQPTPPGNAPTSFPDHSEFIYTVNVTVDGPNDIDASFVFDFSAANDPTLFVIGSRIIAWPYDPQNGVQEALEWVTDIRTALSGHETRTANRQFPRQLFRYNHLLHRDRARSGALNRLIGRQGSEFAVPIWPFTRSLRANVSAGATSIQVDTTNADFRSSTSTKNELVILWQSDTQFEVAQIAVGGVTASTISFSIPLSSSWTAGTKVVPMQIMLAKDPASWTVQAPGVTSLEINWLSHDVANLAATDGELTIYADLPVLTGFNYMDDELQEQLERGYDLFDSETGDFESLYSRLVPEWTSQRGFETQSATTSWALRKLLYALRGRQRSFWMPTGKRDFIMTTQMNSADTTMDVEEVSYTRFVNRQVPFDRIQVELHDGTIFRRQILNNVLDISGTFETLTLDSSFGQTVNPSDIRAISYLVKCRLGSDRVELNHTRLNAISARVPVVGVIQ